MSAAVTMPQGTPVEVTSDVVRRLEMSAAQVRREMEDRTGLDLFQHAYAAIGDQPMATQAAGPFGFAGAVSASHLGEVTIELAPAEDRDITSEELANRWRELTGLIPEAVELKFNASIFSVGREYRHPAHRARPRGAPNRCGGDQGSSQRVHRSVRDR